MSIYYDHDRYTMMGEVFLPPDDDIGFYINQPIEKFSDQSQTKITTANVLLDSGRRSP